MKYGLVIVLNLIFLLSACNMMGDERDLSERDIQNYIKVYNELKKAAPEVLKNINLDSSGLNAGEFEFKEIEKIIQSGGMIDYAEFVRLNAKIGAIFTVIQANKGMDNFQELKNESSQMLDDNVKRLKEQLNDSEIPEETKDEIRKTIAELTENTKKLEDYWVKNKKWADFIISGVEDITDIFVSEEDIELVKKHEAEIMEAYTGIQID